MANGNWMKAKVDIMSRELIKPSSPTPHHKKHLKLSLLDQLAPSMFFTTLFFYQKRRPVDDDPSKTTSLLKQSLSQSLTKFYPLAGKLSPNLVSIDCDDSGALFVEAKVHAHLSHAVQNAPFEEFRQYLPFVPNANHDELLLATYPRNQILLAVQITWFQCGGNAIGVCISHKVADFMSFLMFMNSWAATNRGENSSLLPNFDLGRLIFLPPDIPVSSFPLAADKGKTLWKRLLFDKEKLTELKEVAISSSLSSPSLLVIKDPTRVELVTAFLWKQFINMRRANNQGAKTMSRIWHLVNLRGRMNCLALPSNDHDEIPFGNLIIITSALFSSDKNQGERDDDYRDLVRITSDAIRKVNEDYVVNSAVPFLKSLGTKRGMGEMQQAQTTGMNDATFSSWCRFPIYEVDFGWGKPVSVGPGCVANGSWVILTSTSNEEGIEAWVSLPEDELDLLPGELLSLAATDFFQVNS